MHVTKAAVIQTACDIADEKGLNNVSLKAVAEKLNIRTPSLYNHIGSIDDLLREAAHKLIEEKGRVEGPGRPILYGTTGYFLDYFGLKSLEELPDTQEMEISLEEDVSPDLFFDGMNKGE